MLKLTSRRIFLVSSASTLALLGGCGSEQSEPTPGPVDPEGSPELDIELTEETRELARMVLDEFLLDTENEQFSANVAPLPGPEGGSREDKIARAIALVARRPETKWFYWNESDADSFDYHHLVASGETIATEDGGEVSTGLVEDEFDLTPELLQNLIEANYFDYPISQALEENEDAANRVIVALRGAEIVNDGSGENAQITLRDRHPSHRDPNCVFISWHRKDDEDDTLAVFKGSTVPSEMYLALYQSFDGTMYKSSMMPQGLHTRYVGNMNMSGGVHPNTLRQRSVCPVIREPSKDRDFFDLSHSIWDPDSSSRSARSVGAHIHAGYWDTRSQAGWAWKFSSAGCQTICGSAKDDRKSGDIARFYEAMDIPTAENGDDGFTSDKYGTVYPMVLLTGREARMHAEGAPMSAMRRIRFGSSVDATAEPDHPIVQVQEALGVTADGQFGGGSMLKLIDVQRDGSWMIGSSADGVVTPDLVASQDIELT